MDRSPRSRRSGFERVTLLATGATGQVAPTWYVRRGKEAVVELAELAGLAGCMARSLR